MDGREALTRKLPSSNVTVRDFLLDCLVKLVEETENFSGKRPLGNSDWMEQLCIAVGAAEMRGDDDCWIDYDAGRVILTAAIEELRKEG